MRPPNWLRIGKPRRQGNEVVYPLSVVDWEEAARWLDSAGWTAAEVAETCARGIFGSPSSDDPSLGPDAARWTPEDDA